MKRPLLLAVMAILLVAVFAAAGCGGSSATGGSSGNKSTGKVTEAELGVPIYPGATQEDLANERPSGGGGPNSSSPRWGGSAPEWNGQSAPGWNGQSAPRWNGSVPNRAGPGGSRTALWTKDSVDKVTAWYKEKLKGKSGYKEITAQSGAAPSGNTALGGGIAFSFTSGDTTKMVMIRASRQSKGGTTIMIGDGLGGMPSAPSTNQSY